MSMKHAIIGLAILVVLVASYVLYPKTVNTTKLEVSTKPDAVQFVYANASDNMIQVDLPFPGAIIGTEFTVRGKARGTWYFEASFPVVLVDRDGKDIAVGFAEADGEWMTEEFVPFSSQMVVTGSYRGPATLILKKDNPSGMSENDASVSFPVTVE